MAARQTLDPKLDIVFWMLFGAERNRQLLISLLDAVIRPPAPITEVEVLHAQPERANVVDKNIALDIRCRLSTGEQVDIEMQSQKRPAQMARALYYWARLYAGQLKRGAPYTTLRRCVVVMIADFVELAEERFHSRFGILERQTAEPLTDHLELHFIELPKIRTALLANDEPRLLQWARFLDAKSDDELEQLAMESPILRQAKDALEALSADDEARMRAEQRETAMRMNEFDLGAAYEQGLAVGVAQGKAEGVAQGKAEGVAQGKVEALRQLIALRFGAMGEEAERRMASASPEDVERWTSQLFVASSLDDIFGNSAR